MALITSAGCVHFRAELQPELGPDPADPVRLRHLDARDEELGHHRAAVVAAALDLAHVHHVRLRRAVRDRRPDRRRAGVQPGPLQVIRAIMLDDSLYFPHGLCVPGW